MKKIDALPPLKKTLKQKIEIKAQRIRKYKKQTKFYVQNNIFTIDKSKYYRILRKSQVNVEKPPTKNETRNVWESI